MGREEIDHGIVEKGETAGAEALGVGGQIGFARSNARVKLGCTIAQGNRVTGSILHYGQ